MKVKIVEIKPVMMPNADKAYKRAIENAGNMSAAAVKVDFGVTTQTWKTRPEMSIEHTAESYTWKVGTDDKIYRFVSDGTRPHVIVPRVAKRLSFFSKGFRPKTRVGWIGSNKGSQATRGRVVTTRVNHPGTQARKFEDAIQTKWNDEWPRQLDRAIRAVKAYG